MAGGRDRVFVAVVTVVGMVASGMQPLPNL